MRTRNIFCDAILPKYCPIGKDKRTKIPKGSLKQRKPSGIGTKRDENYFLAVAFLVAAFLATGFLAVAVFAAGLLAALALVLAGAF